MRVSTALVLCIVNKIRQGTSGAKLYFISIAELNRPVRGVDSDELVDISYSTNL